MSFIILGRLCAHLVHKKLKHAFSRKFQWERLNKLKEVLYSRLMKCVDIKPMEEHWRWKYIAFYTIVSSHNMIHRPYRLVENTAIPFFPLHKISGEYTFSKIVIDLVVCCQSQVKVVQIMIHAINSGAASKCWTDANSLSIFSFCSCFQLK